MHYVTHRSQLMQKCKFSVTCPNALFVESVSVPPEHKKKCIHVLRPEHTGIHYVTRRSHQMQKYKFSVTYPSVLFIESVLVPPEHEK
jgi:hypothetical protein